MNDIDPLALVKQYLVDKKIDERTYELIIDKMSVVEDGIKRIERKTSIDYPNYFIEPNLLVATSDIEYQQYSILYARTIPFCTTENRIKIVIQLSAPLVMYGLKGTLHAVLAHEFLHYLNILKNIINLEVTSDDVSDTLYENSFSDNERTLHAVLAHEFLHYLNILKNIINLEVTSDNVSDTLYENSFSDNERTLDLTKVFRRDIYLQKLVHKKFVDGFNDSKLDKKAESFWIKKKLPIQKIMIGDNFIKLPFSALANTIVEDSLKNEISKFV